LNASYCNRQQRFTNRHEQLIPGVRSGSAQRLLDFRPAFFNRIQIQRMWRQENHLHPKRSGSFELNEPLHISGGDKI
jgi:hypothetical protein